MAPSMKRFVDLADLERDAVRDLVALARNQIGRAHV